MGKILVVAEKPSVGRDIARVLGARGKGEGMIEGDNHLVTWAFGHLVRLSDPEEINPEWKKWRAGDLPMLPELTTQVIDKTRAQFSLIKKLMNSKEVDSIICATDSGREGELIFRLIYQHAGCKKPVQRLWISSMTDEAIIVGLKSLKPASAFDALFVSARCRSEADWLVGMNATRAFTLRYGVLLSVGRVQTPTLALLVQRDLEIAAFVPREYWEIKADFGDYAGAWQDPETKELRCYDQARAAKIKAEVQGKPAEVILSEREDKRTPPPRLHELTSLQREANQMLGLSAANTLSVAQSLYEKYKLITYPRTDSAFLPQGMADTVKSALAALPDPYKALAAPLTKNLPVTARVYDDAKLTDHHAIITTGKPLPAGLPDLERKVFDLVARRMIAAHYPDYCYQSQKVITQAAGHEFLSSGVTPIEEGWRAVYRDKQTEKEEKLPLLQMGDQRTVQSAAVKKLKTKPPDKLTDATLLKAMQAAGKTLEDEELRESMKDSGLGTPATRAAIIERLIEVGYARRAAKALESTEKGRKLIEVAPEEIRSAETTGRWEKALAAIAKSSGEEAGQLPARFMDGIRRYTAFLVESATKSPAVQFEREEKTGARPGGTKGGSKSTVKVHDIKCPLCHAGSVTESPRAFGCSEWKNGCKFTVWKDSLSRHGGPNVTMTIVKKLAAGQPVAKDGYEMQIADGRFSWRRSGSGSPIPRKTP